MQSRYAHLSPTHITRAVEGLATFQGQISGGTVTKTVTGGSEEEPEDTQVVDISGEPRAARTHDPRLKRAMLYQLS